jgi:hypothetical protein
MSMNMRSFALGFNLGDGRWFQALKRRGGREPISGDYPGAAGIIDIDENKGGLDHVGDNPSRVSQGVKDPRNSVTTHP